MILLAINVFFVVFFWKRAKEYFDQGMNGLGYLDLFVSALNGAFILMTIFP